jgi:circadian clock protein KaiC
MAGDVGGSPELLETGVPNLDRVLGGGLARRATAMVIGAPGSGKTILALQIAFHQAARGARALYLTGYSETHDKLLSYGHGLGFFAPAVVGRQIQLGSLPDLLRRGAEAAEAAITTTARAQDASLIVLDGLRSMRGILGDEQEAAHFLYALGAKLALLGATTLIVVEGDPDDSRRYPELTACDVILGLRRERREGRQRRLLEVVKARGAAPLGGDHFYTIEASGISLFPRFESIVAATEPAWDAERAGFGIVEVDALLGGGLTAGTATLVAGSPGVGKTLLGLHFLADGARRGEPGLLLGFMEGAAQLREKARAFGLDLATAEAAGTTSLLVLPSYELEADAIAQRLCEDVERRGVQRLVIDSAAEVERGIGSPGRTPEFVAALVSYLRGRGVTTYLTLDIPTIVGPELALAGTPLSVLAENLLLLRRVEYRGRLHWVFAIFKMRFSDHDPGIHEYAICPGVGIRLLGPAPPGEGLLTGIVRPSTEGPGQPPWDDEGRPWPRS